MTPRALRLSIATTRPYPSTTADTPLLAARTIGNPTSPTRELLHPDTLEKPLHWQVFAERHEMDLVVGLLKIALVAEDHEAVVALAGCAGVGQRLALQAQ